MSVFYYSSQLKHPLSSNWKFSPEMWIQRGERVLIYSKKCPVMFTHLNSLPNNQINNNYMTAVKLELLKQLVIFGHIFSHSCFLSWREEDTSSRPSLWNCRVNLLALNFPKCKRKASSIIHQPLLFIKHKHYSFTNPQTSAYDKPLAINDSFHFWVFFFINFAYIQFQTLLCRRVEQQSWVILY